MVKVTGEHYYASYSERTKGVIKKITRYSLINESLYKIQSKYILKRIIAIIFITLVSVNSNAQTDRQVFDFEFEGLTLNGVLNLPKDNKPKGIVLIVHGSGRTNAVAQEWYADVRETIVKAGYGTYMWDKMGCGKSGGTFNYHQSVQSSASEVIAAIRTLEKREIPGSDGIGLWGISRAGWINPLVINQYKDIKFWISVSGVDDKENFTYLLEQNLKINGHPKDSVDIIVNEWLEGTKINHAGGNFETYQNATPNLKQNEFWLRFTNGGITEDGYYDYQKTFTKEELDEQTGLQVYIKNFDTILSRINCPVLALFGEKDMNVEWAKTKSLYENTLDSNNLTIKSFPNCNHNLFQCETGGFYEFQDDNLPWTRCNGFLDTIANWLHQIE